MVGATATRLVGLDSVSETAFDNLLLQSGAGFLVGVGTKIGHGCTSGHGVCGLGRRSSRSLVAVLSFMGAAMLVSHATLDVAAFRFAVAPVHYANGSWLTAAAALSAVPLLTAYVGVSQQMVALSRFSWGCLFGMGLSLSGMGNPAKHTGFLQILSGHWDPSLACVMAAALSVFVLADLKKQSMRKPILSSKFPSFSSKIEPSLVIGGAIFGIGWGLGSMCPGPAVANLTSGSVAPFLWLGSMMCGAWLAEKI